MKISRDFMRLYIIPVVLFAGILLTAAFTLFYTTTARTPEGGVVSGNWPKDFTKDFASAITFTESAPMLTEAGKDQLRENGLWLQVLDAAGTEILCFDKPASVPESYQPYAFLRQYQSGTGAYSVFVGELENGRCYLIGFPLTISKVVMYVDTQRYDSGKALILATVILTALTMLALTVFYNAVITRNFSLVRTSLRAVAERTYTPKRHGSFMREIYESIDLLNQDIAAADRQRERDEKAKEEWLANITHDLKTPLSPIRGYAELISEGSEQPAAQYGTIILKNTLYAEQLVDDLKLTYQLRSNTLPLNMTTRNITRFVREIVIDLLNAPDSGERRISFASDCENAVCAFDERLLRRAVTNILENAFKHNAPDTEIAVKVEMDDGIHIIVSDNGKGMTSEELDGLFTRYYRGTSTREKTEGSGLGMAIARQIALAHGGEIRAESTVGVGTTITIRLANSQSPN